MHRAVFEDLGCRPRRFSVRRSSDRHLATSTATSSPHHTGCSSLDGPLSLPVPLDGAVRLMTATLCVHGQVSQRRYVTHHLREARG